MARSGRVTVADLEHAPARSLLYCCLCGAENSASSGDYFMSRPTHVFTCCGRNMVLVTKQTTYTVVSLQGDSR